MRTSAERESRLRRELPAKASAPRLANAVPRPRVFRILDRALGRGAVWIGASAGAGKTTAVASYLAARSRPAVWYEIDTTDSDVANVFLCLSQAVRAVTRSRRALPVFRVQHLGSLRAFAQKFFHAVYAALPNRAALVLDNCHAIAGDRAWAEIMDEAVLACRGEQRLVLVSRGSPPAELARQILNQHLAQLSGDDLRFTDQEVGALVRTRVPAGVRRDKGALAALCALADGWAAGLVLVLDHAARGETTAEIARHDARLFDYFSTEILSQLSPDAQTVLLATALLPCMTERMAEAVTESGGAGAVVADLHRRGLLVERLPSRETTYRYHPLLRGFLLTRAAPSAALLARAAAACAAGGFLDEAIDLHARAGAEAEVAALVVAHAPRLVAEGRYGTLSSWLAKVGAGTLASQPWLRFWQATANVPHDQAASRAQFEQAFAGFEACGDAAGIYLAIAGAVQVIFIEGEDFDRAHPWFERFARLEVQGPPAPSEDVDAAALTSLLMAVSYGHPCLSHAAAWVDRALALEPPGLGARVRLWSSLIMYLSIVGRAPAALDLMDKLRAEITPVLDPVTRIMAAEAELPRFFVGSWLEALDSCKRALTIARVEGLHLFEATNLAAAAHICSVGGDLAAAADYIEQAAAAGATMPSSHLLRSGVFEYSQAIYHFAKGEFARAIELVTRGLERAARAKMRFGEIMMRTLRCLAFDACERHDEARAEAARLTGSLSPMGVSRAGLDLFHAEATLRDGHAGSSETALSVALDGIRRFPNFGMFYVRALPNVIAAGLRHSAHAKWLAEQLAGHRIVPWSQHLDSAVWPWPLRARTLGGFALEGHSSAGSSRKEQKAPLRLFKCLVAAGGEPLSVGAACDALWPREAPAAARRRLDITLHRLRKLVGEQVVRLNDGALAIDRERCFVDAWAFASLAARAERRLHRAHGEAGEGEARTLFDDACRLYRGVFLPEDEDVPSIVSCREQLRRRFVHLVLTFGAALERHAWHEAVVLYEHGVEIEELAEPLSQGLMRCYLALGRPADVAKEYHRCLLALQAARGTTPSEETRALYQKAHAPAG